MVWIMLRKNSRSSLVDILIPPLVCRKVALVAQGIEHRIPNPGVAGSIPAGGTKLSSQDHFSSRDHSFLIKYSVFCSLLVCKL
jgi:hypothetical protein